MPYVLETDRPDYGGVHSLSPLVRRVLANNPHPMTYSGSGTHIVGRGKVALIDPGPDLPGHVDALLAATRGEEIGWLVCTHTHLDHSPAAALLKQRTGAQIVGCAALVLADDGPRADEGFDTRYAPDAVLENGEFLRGDGWTLEAVATPGHTSNHLCYALHEEKALFTGDHVMGWSTTVVSPPDGDMADYMASLRRLTERDDHIYYPTHGRPIDKPQAYARALLAHRKLREGQILDCIGQGLDTIPAMVARLYATTPKILHGAASRSVLAHLNDLTQRGIIAENVEQSTYALRT